MQGENKNYGKEKGNIMVAKSFEEFFKVKKDKEINKKKRRINHDVRNIRSIEEAEEWEEVDKEDKEKENVDKY